MSYALVDDSFYDHPKVMDLMLRPGGKSALGMWPIALSWAHRHTISKPNDQQGVIPPKMIQAWDRLFGDVQADAEALTDVGLWDHMGGGYYRIHDFRHWAQLDVREAKQKAGRASAHKRWGTPLPFDVTDYGSVTDAVTNRPSNGSGNSASNTPGNGPSNNVNGCVSNPQDQDQVQEHQNLSSTDVDVEVEFDRFWMTYPRRIGKQAALKAWRKACRLTSPSTIIGAAVAYAELRGDQDPKYTAHPATWLNQGRWDDEPDDDKPTERFIR